MYTGGQKVPLPLYATRKARGDPYDKFQGTISDKTDGRNLAAYNVHLCTRYTCMCANGVPMSGASCTVSGAAMCESCAPGYFLNGARDACVPCTPCTAGMHESRACSDWSDRICSDNLCGCPSGNAETGSACAKPGLT